MWRPIMTCSPSVTPSSFRTCAAPEDRPSRPAGYDKKNMAVDIHELTATLGLERAASSATTSG